MALIDTEEAAKRLARVILSDIELYSRERPAEGESLEAQIQEGSRLFGSRVTPALRPLFDQVLATRRAGNENTPLVQVVAAPAPDATPTATPTAVTAIGEPNPGSAVDQERTPVPVAAGHLVAEPGGARPAPPASPSDPEDQRTPGPDLVASALSDAPPPLAPARSKPAPRPQAARSRETRNMETRNNIRRISVQRKAAPAEEEATVLVDAPLTLPVAPVRQSQSDDSPALPIALSLPVSRVPVETPEPPVIAASTALPEPVPITPSGGTAVPVLTSRFSLVRWVALAGATAATVALLYRFLR